MTAFARGATNSRTRATRTGEEPSVVLNNVTEGQGNFGCNAATGAVGCFATTPVC